MPANSIDDILYELSEAIRVDEGCLPERVKLAAYIRRIEAGHETLRAAVLSLSSSIRSFAGDVSTDSKIPDNIRRKAHDLWHVAGVVQSAVVKLS